jgi:hypothetical protein
MHPRAEALRVDRLRSRFAAEALKLSAKVAAIAAAADAVITRVAVAIHCDTTALQ